jgi:hypothetical protein
MTTPSINNHAVDVVATPIRAERIDTYAERVDEHQNAELFRKSVIPSTDVVLWRPPASLGQPKHYDAPAGNPLGLSHAPVPESSYGLAIPEVNSVSAAGYTVDSDGVATEAVCSSSSQESGDASEDLCYRLVTSTATQIDEAHAGFVAQKLAETGGQKAHAKERSTVFSGVQYRYHPDTGAVLLTQEQLDEMRKGLEADEILEMWADIWHDKDRFSEAEAVVQRSAGRNVNPGDLKPLHCHLVIKLKPKCERSIRNMSDRGSIPASRFETPKELRTRGKRIAERGPKVAIDAFFYFAEYLTHERYALGDSDD